MTPSADSRVSGTGTHADGVGAQLGLPTAPAPLFCGCLSPKPSQAQAEGLGRSGSEFFCKTSALLRHRVPCNLPGRCCCVPPGCASTGARPRDARCLGSVRRGASPLGCTVPVRPGYTPPGVPVPRCTLASVQTLCSVARGARGCLCRSSAKCRRRKLGCRGGRLGRSFPGVCRLGTQSGWVFLTKHALLLKISQVFDLRKEQKKACKGGEARKMRASVWQQRKRLHVWRGGGGGGRAGHGSCPSVLGAHLDGDGGPPVLAGHP